MKNVKKFAAQGDTLYRRVDSLPSDAVAAEKSKSITVAHSETGHDHVAGSEFPMQLFASSDPQVAYLKVTAPVDIVHHRAWDTHETLRLLSDGEGETIWEIRRQREWMPEGWRRVED